MAISYIGFQHYLPQSLLTQQLDLLTETVIQRACSSKAQLIQKLNILVMCFQDELYTLIGSNSQIRKNGGMENLKALRSRFHSMEFSSTLMKLATTNVRLTVITIRTNLKNH